MKKFLFIVLLITILFTACRRETADNSLTGQWMGDFNTLPGTIVSAYRGEVRDAEGVFGGTATFAELENGHHAISLVGGAPGRVVGAVGETSFSDDFTYFFITDAEHGHIVNFVVMPSDDIEEDLYYIIFLDYDVSGFIPAVKYYH